MVSASRTSSVRPCSGPSRQYSASGASRDYVKPVQEENALLESETFSTVLKAGFAAFCLVCVLLVFKLAGPVVNEMVSTFPGASSR